MTHWSLIIAASQRSGSTLLGRALELTGTLGKPREWLQNSDRQACLRAYGMPPDAPYEESVRAIVQNETSPEGVFPLKVMWDTMEIFLQRLRWGAQQPLDPDTEWQRMCGFFPDPRFLLITRSNKLKQAVSFVKSLQTGVWEDRGKSAPVDPQLVEFDYLAIADAIAKFEAEEQQWRDFFRRHGRAWMEIEYESFVADYDGTLRKVFDFLKLPQPVAFGRDKMDLKVMSDGINRQWIERYRDLQQVLPAVAADAPADSALPSIRVPGLPDSLQRSMRFRLRCTIINNGTVPLISWRSADGSGWRVLRAFWSPEDTGQPLLDDGRGYAWQPIAPGAEGTVECVLTAPDKPGRYRLLLDFYAPDAPVPVQPLAECSMQVVLSDAEATIQEFFPDAVSQLGNWLWIPWLGYFYMGSFPWMCHEHLGWFLFDPKASSPQEFWFWEKTLGWFTTAPGAFPQILRKDPVQSLTYTGMQDGKGRFKPLDGGETLDISPKFQ